MRIEGVIATTASATQAPMKPPEGPHALTNAMQATVTPKTSQEKEAIGEKMLDQAVEQTSEVLAAFDEVLKFSVHKETNRYVIKLVNQQTGEVLREYPPEKFLDMIANFQKQIAGLFVDTER
jgi:flagellar protein FlaG